MLQLEAVNKEIGSFDIYNIYDTCAGDTAKKETWKRTWFEWNELMNTGEVVVEGQAAPAHPQVRTPPPPSYPCRRHCRRSRLLPPRRTLSGTHTHILRRMQLCSSVLL